MARWLRALTRGVSPSIDRCELTHLDRVPIDVARAKGEHRLYEEALERLGIAVERLPTDPELPDSVFIEDTAIVLDEVAVITRPGAESRRPETAAVVEALRHYRELVFITEPGTLDGGDVLRVGRRMYVGLSARSSRSAIEQLAAAVAPFSFEVIPIPITGCLHLKSAVTQVEEETLLLNSRWVDPKLFHGFSLIEVATGEEQGANALFVNDAVLYPAAFPRTAERLADAGIAVQTIEAGELAKAEGALTCCSLIFRA